MNQPTDPLLEAIADAVWRECRTERPSAVVDHPRNIAAVAAAVARAVSSAGQAPATETAPSHRAGLHDDIAAAVRAQAETGNVRYEAIADAVLAVLYREWPWLRAEAEDTAVLPAPTDQAAAEADADTVANRAAQVITTMGAEIRELKRSRDRYRTAWLSARQRAQAYGEGILRLVADRDWWKGQAHTVQARAETADRAAVLEETATALEAQTCECGCRRGAEFIRQCAAELRRMADETATTQAQPVSTAPLAAGLPLVKGNCPACGGSSLFLGDGGYVTCSRIDCPEPDAASTTLEQPAADETATTQTEPGTCGHRSSEGHPCNEPPGHFGYHRNARQGGNEWTSWVGDTPVIHEDEGCGAEPPDGWPGDCWCTLAAGHEGLHQCGPCSTRHDAPGWSDEPAARARQDGAQRPGLRDRHHAAWAALTPDQQAARLAELDEDEQDGATP